MRNVKSQYLKPENSTQSTRRLNNIISQSEWPDHPRVRRSLNIRFHSCKLFLFRSWSCCAGGLANRFESQDIWFVESSQLAVLTSVYLMERTPSELVVFSISNRRYLRIIYPAAHLSAFPYTQISPLNEINNQTTAHLHTSLIFYTCLFNSSPHHHHHQLCSWSFLLSS